MIYAAHTIVFLHLFPIIVQPITGTIMGMRIFTDNVFQENRTERIFHILKKGMFK